MIRITKKHLHFSNVKFVISAVDKNNKVKPFFNNLFADSENIVGSDSHRMHIIKNEMNLTEGQYEIIKNTNSEIILEFLENPDSNYPNYKHIIPGDSENTRFDLPAYNDKSGPSAAIRKMYVEYPKILFNVNFLFDALNDIKKDFLEFTAFIYGSMSVIKLISKDERRTALIMPVKYDNF